MHDRTIKGKLYCIEMTWHCVSMAVVQDIEVAQADGALLCISI